MIPPAQDMAGQAAHSESHAPRVLVLDADRPHDVFDVLGEIDGDESTEQIIRVRSPFLFEIGEALTIRIEQDGASFDALARVRAHLGPSDARITELEITERLPTRVVG